MLFGLKNNGLNYSLVINVCIPLVAVYPAIADSSRLSHSAWSKLWAWLKQRGHTPSSTAASFHSPYASTALPLMINIINHTTLFSPTASSEGSSSALTLSTQVKIVFLGWFLPVFRLIGFLEVLEFVLFHLSSLVSLRANTDY